MISPEAFHQTLATAGIEFFAGVPDSLLKEFCAYIDAALPPENHVITVNEGAAVGLAAGVHLATGSVPLVYLQNSGLGNIVNPALSLADPEIYAIPMIFLIGWRGEPGVGDEPQHVKQGRVTPALLDAMEMPWRELDGDPGRAVEAALWASRTARATNAPVALVVHKGAFAKAERKRPARVVADTMIAREAAIQLVAGLVSADATIVSTTGMISRELYEHRKRARQGHAADFLTVGSMGHASQIALGIARARPEANIVCLDGDGAALMHMGGLTTIGQSARGNLFHIVLNNGAHDSVGGQPTSAFDVSLTGIARACGYGAVEGPAETEADIRAAVARLAPLPGRRFLEIRVRPGSRGDLGRPFETPAENKALFVERLRGAGAPAAGDPPEAQ